MSEAKKLTAPQEEVLRQSMYWGEKNAIAAQIWATLDAERAKVEALEAELDDFKSHALTLRAMLQGPDRGPWCQPPDEKGRACLVQFADRDVRTAVFDNEVEAREFYERRKPSWNCYLFLAAPATAGQARATAAEAEAERQKGLAADLAQALNSATSGLHGLSLQGAEAALHRYAIAKEKPDAAE